jgi:putative flippase GtrA
MSLLDRLKLWLRLLGKYGLTSLTATGIDFTVFHLALTLVAAPAVQATVAGRCAGAVVSFWLQRRWVFRAAYSTHWQPLVVKYGSGVLLGMGMNVGGVWLLHDICDWRPWPARIAAATATWIIVFLFNHRVVFNPASNQGPYNYRT